MKSRFVFFLLVCTYLTVFANDRDSFQTGINTTGLKDSVDYFLLESELLIDSNPIQSFDIALKAQELSLSLKYYERNAYASRLLGEAKLNIQDYYEAEKHLSTALHFYQNTRKDVIIADIQYLLGLTRNHLSKYHEALEDYFTALETYRNTDETQKYANTLQNIGLVYNNIADFDKSEEYYYKALALNKGLEQDHKIAELYQSLGIICYKKAEDSLALNYYEKSISYFKKSHDLNGIGVNYSNIGLIHLKNKDLHRAYKFFEKANTYFVKTKFFMGQMWAHNNMGAASASDRKFERAEYQFLTSLKIAEELSSFEGVLTNYQDLSKYYEQTGDFKQALNYHKLYAQINDSISSVNSNKKVSKLETLYLLESKEKEIALSEIEHNRRTTQLFSFLSIIIIIGFAAAILFTSFFQKRKAERRLSMYKVNLQGLIEKRTKELKIQINERKTAEESDKLKSAFLANMSHELRTPMNAIIAFSNFLREPDLEEDQKGEYLDHITTAGDTLLCLIDDIIDIAKIESQQLKIFIQPTNINHLLLELYKVFTELRSKYNKNNIEFNLNSDDNYNYIINTDSKRLKQVLSNLLDNAFKYTNKGRIEIGFETTENSVSFYVTDTGSGIPKDKQDMIFDRFYQLRNSNDRRTSHGTGLGLAICKNLTKLLGGKIWVDSDNSGSTFMIRIPVDSIKKQVNTSFNSKKKTKRGLKPVYNWSDITILVAEDEDLNYRVLDTCLTRTKAHIIRARDGASAVEICKNQKVDIVLMDIQMPGMDGYEATQEIKRFNNRTPVIAQTSFAMTGERERCLQAGCDDFITKPLDIDFLLEKIKGHIFTTAQNYRL